MASKSQIWEAFAAATGGSAATYAKIDRSLIHAGLSPRGGQGGGRNVARIDQHYLAALIVATGAPLPSEAAETVREFASCIYVRSAKQTARFADDFSAMTREYEPFTADPLKGSSLLDYLARRIKDWAVLSAEVVAAMEAMPAAHRSEIRLDFGPVAARLEFSSVNLDYTNVHHFTLPAEPPAEGFLFSEAAPEPLKGVRAPIRRSCVLPLSLLFVATELFREEQESRGQLPLSGTGEEEAATPKNEKTPGQPRPGALTENQPREPKAGHSHIPGNNGVRAEKQARTGTRGADTRKGLAFHEVRC